MDKSTIKFFERLDDFLNKENEKADQIESEVTFIIDEIAEAIEVIKDKHRQCN